MRRAYHRRRLNLTPAQAIVSFYLLAIAASTALLSLPGVVRPGVHVPFIDTLFMAVTSVSVTGLTTVNLAETYTTAGYFVILLILQVGGVGVMSLGTFVWLLLGRKIGLRERELIMVDQNQYSNSTIVGLILDIIRILLLIEAGGTIVLTVYLKQYYAAWTDAALNGLFATISALTNAGVDITGASLIPYHHDYFVQFFTVVLIVLGAIGFPVLVELKMFLSDQYPRFRFSLFTKLTVATYAILLVAGTALIWLMELRQSFQAMPWHEAFFTALFHSASTRSAGLVAFDVTQFHEATNLLMSLYMFIGGSPSSVGGGIRTTTVAVAALFLYNFANGRDSIQVFGREIERTDVYRSFVVIFLASTLVLVSVLALLYTEAGLTMLQIIFEVTSAFGTCGMSLGATEELSSVGKCIIMFLMFVGRVGMMSFLYSLGGKAERALVHYPKERVIIG